MWHYNESRTIPSPNSLCLEIRRTKGCIAIIQINSPLIFSPLTRFKED